MCGDRLDRDPPESETRHTSVMGNGKLRGIRNTKTAGRGDAGCEGEGTGPLWPSAVPMRSTPTPPHTNPPTTNAPNHPHNKRSSQGGVEIFQCGYHIWLASFAVIILH